MAVEKIRIIRVEFQDTIHFNEICEFRNAVIERVGEKNGYFTNIIPARDVRYAYPLIQYKQLYGKAAIVCLNEATDELHNFFSKEQNPLALNNKTIRLNLDALRFSEHQLNINPDKLYEYSFRNWVAITQKNLKEYKMLNDISEIMDFLRTIMFSNLRNICEGLGQMWDNAIELNIKKIFHGKIHTIKDASVQSFTGVFVSNIYLPDYIGIGKFASIGYGTIKRIIK